MRILIIEDNEFDFLMLKRNLERAFCDEEIDVTWVSEPRVETLVEGFDDYDICFVDHRLPSVFGTEIIKAMTSAGVQTPMILLTGEQLNDLDQEALSVGASDFLHKDKLSVSSVLRSTRHCITRKDQERRLREMAYTDPLTTLANRAAFDERCKAGLARVKSTGRRLSLILMDLDGFKKINDVFGHPHGDKLLQMFAIELKSHFKDTDLVARLGGDEFAVLIETTDGNATPNEVRNSLREVLSTTFDFPETIVTACSSIGVCVVDAAQPDVTPTDLLHRADRSLYSDKRRRKFLETQDISNEYVLDLDIEKTVQDLEQAIAADEFELFFQPKVNFSSGEITGLEALLRWTGSSNGLGPDVFIPIAEEYGLINDIGAWVLRRCCAQYKEWQKQGYIVPTISVNVSPLQLESGRFYQVVSQTLREFEMRPSSIEFELTEGSFSHGADIRIEQMRQISDLGCCWAIDDFGIGYSSLSRLHTLPISKLKIDKSFVGQLPRDKAARDISNTIISMARNLNLGVVAEGVKNRAQLDDLDLAESDELQGYLCFRPMNAGSITELLTNMVGHSGAAA